jgi:lipoprotein-anchoring transpeptidase ErfK/SrfK
VREATDRVVLVGTGPTPLEEAQALLADLGYPVGPVDGIDGPQTQRALCAWRRLEGHDVSRASLQEGELEALREASGLPAADRSGRGVTVDRTCQVLYYQEDGRWQRVHAASTGADGLPRQGSYRIERVRPGWHTSTLYPAPEPNMYNSMYFRGAIAIHGSHHVPTHPASKGCVRVTPEVADLLFAELTVGDPVEVIGTY